MINRILIRARIIQVVYAWYQCSDKEIRTAEKNLLLGFQKSYDLYFYMLLLMIEVTRLYEARVETKRNKYLPTEEDKNPDLQLLENKFIRQLRENEAMQKFLNERPLSWQEHMPFVRNILNKILESDIYAEYISTPQPTYEQDREFWRKIFKTFIAGNSSLEEILEDESIFWNDDIDIIQSFVLKTIKRFEEKTGTAQALLPMFKDEADKKFAIDLLYNALDNEKKYREIILRHAENWEQDRIALIDLVIMQVAIAELTAFIEIPTSVTLNEYIDIAKIYSTPKSGTFINGILDAVVQELKKENKLII